MIHSQNAQKRSLLSTIFVSPEEPRLRAGWRLLIQVLIQLGLTIFFGLCIAIPALLFHWNLDLSNPTVWVGNEAVELLTILISVWIARRLLDRRSFLSIGLEIERRMWVDLAAGIVISAVLMGAVFLAEASAGWLSVQGFAWQGTSPTQVFLPALAFLIAFILGGFNEELMSRGYHLQTIASGMNLAWGLILSSVVFGALHLGNPHASLISTVGIIGAGAFFGLAYIWTRRLWLPIGLHLGWNYFEGVVFGFPVSGLETFRLMHTNVSGPTIWTGGAFGPEAGILSILAILLGVLLVFLYSRVRARS